MPARFLLASLLCLPLGCVAYAPRVDVEVRDPRRVQVEPASTHETFEPASVGRATPVPSTDSDVERASNGALEVNGRTVVGRDGSISSAIGSLDDTWREGDGLRVRICHHGRYGPGCLRDLWLATPMNNVTLLRSRETPVWLVGFMELVASAGMFAGSDVAWDRYSSGGPLLVGAGALLAVLGVIQLAAPSKDVTTIVPGGGE